MSQELLLRRLILLAIIVQSTPNVVGMRFVLAKASTPENEASWYGFLVCNLNLPQGESHPDASQNRMTVIDTSYTRAV